MNIVNATDESVKRGEPLRDAAGRIKRRGNDRPWTGRTFSVMAFETPLDEWATHYLLRDGVPFRDALNHLHVGSEQYLRELIWRSGGSEVAA